MKWLGFYWNLREVKQLRGKQWFSWAARQSVCRATHGLCGQEFHVMSPAETFKSELYVWPVRLCSFLFLKIMDFHPYSLDLLCFTHHFPEFSKEAVCGNNRWTKNYQGLFLCGGSIFRRQKEGIYQAMHRSTIYALENLSHRVLNWSVKSHCQRR